MLASRVLGILPLTVGGLPLHHACPRYLEPQLCIQMSGSMLDPEPDRLPTSATCMNLLKLPPYRNHQMMKDKLLYAIHSTAGFDLS